MTVLLNLILNLTQHPKLVFDLKQNQGVNRHPSFKLKILKALAVYGAGSPGLCSGLLMPSDSILLLR